MEQNNQKSRINLEDLAKISSGKGPSLKELLIPFGMTKRIMRTRDPRAGVNDPAPYVALSTGIAQLLPYAALGYIVSQYLT